MPKYFYFPMHNSYAIGPKTNSRFNEKRAYEINMFIVKIVRFKRANRTNFSHIYITYIDLSHVFYTNNSDFFRKSKK